MGLAEIQKALARIYVDSHFRESFFDDPQSIGFEMGLSADEAIKLAEISAERLDLFVDSLKWKRLNETGKALPASRRLLGESFKKLFLEYADSFIPKGVKKHIEDAVNFSGYLSKENRTEPHIAEIARFEAAHLIAMDPSRRLIVRLFRFPIRRILKQIADNSSTLSAKPSITIAIWFRPMKRSFLRRLIY